MIVTEMAHAGEGGVDHLEHHHFQIPVYAGPEQTTGSICSRRTQRTTPHLVKLGESTGMLISF